MGARTESRSRAPVAPSRDMTPPPASGSVCLRPISRVLRVLGRTTLVMMSLLLGLPGSGTGGALMGQVRASEGGPGEVARLRIQGGPELWVAERPGEGPAGITFVLPGDADGGGGRGILEALVTGLGATCPGPPPVLGAGADYETLSFAVAPGQVDTVLGCLDGLFARGADRGAAGSPTDGSSEGEQAPQAQDLQAYRTASGALLATLYAPAPVPGGSLGGGPGDRGVPRGPSHVIVVGPVNGVRVERSAEAAFATDEGRSSPQDGGESSDSAATAPVPSPPVSTEVLILDRPGQSLAELRAGQLVLPGDHPDWAALVVAREILADRLQGGPWAFAELLRVRGPGAFIAGSNLPLDVVPDALDLLWSELESLRDRLAEPAELATATRRLAGSFTEATGGAPALAQELARVAALGLGPEAVAEYPARLAALTPDAVRRAARAHLDPSSLLIAVAGDGAALSRALARFGPVRAVVPPPPPTEWPGLTVDGSVLRPWIGRYRVRIGGREVGTAEREVVRVTEDRIWLRTAASIGDGELTQEMQATLPGLAFAVGTSLRGGQSAGTLRREGDRLVGTGPVGAPVELVVPTGTVVADLLEPTLWASTLAVGGSYRIPVSTPSGDAVEWAAVQVLGRETVDVPAGTYETLRVVVTGPEILTLWLDVERPHRTVRLLGANGVVLELVEEDDGGG